MFYRKIGESFRCGGRDRQTKMVASKLSVVTTLSLEGARLFADYQARKSEDITKNTAADVSRHIFT